MIYIAYTSASARTCSGPFACTQDELAVEVGRRCGFYPDKILAIECVEDETTAQHLRQTYNTMLFKMRMES